MASSRPSLQTLIDRIKADIKSVLGITTIIRRSFINAFVRALGGVSHTILGYIDFIVLQIFPDTAEGEYLLRHATTRGVNRVQATYTQLEIKFTGTDGKVIPAGTLVQSDAGYQYQTDEEGTIAGGEALINVTAKDSGSITNLDDADPVNLVSPISGVNSAAQVNSTIIEGAAAEIDDSLRSRLLTRIQQPPSGGNANDYIQWALEVAGVTRAWVFPCNTGAGTVGVSFVQDAEEDIIPSAAKIQEVQEYIDAVKPVTANVTVFAPTPIELDMTIKLSPNTSTVQEACDDELRDLIAREAQVAGSWAGPTTTNDGSLLLSRINEALSLANGEDDHEIQSILGGAVQNVTVTTGQLLVPGEITWQPIA